VREDQVSHNPVLESFTFRVFVQQGQNPMIFRVSRILLDSINRPVNTEKHTYNFREEFTAIKETIFRVYSFPFILFYDDD
jgi:hypothetical protein